MHRWQPDYVRKWVLAKMRTFWPNPGEDMRPVVVKKGFRQTCKMPHVLAMPPAMNYKLAEHA